MNDNIFEKIARREIPAHIIYEDDDVCSFLDAFPITQGHSLVIPKKRYKRLEDVPENILMKVIKVIQIIAPIISRAVGANGYNIGLNNGSVAGQVIGHVHWHIIPRRHNDGLVSWPNKTVDKSDLEKTAEMIRTSLRPL